MTGCKETQCTRCIHREVCALKEDFLDACSAVSNLVYSRAKDGENVRLSDIPFIKPAELQCKYYYPLPINTKRVPYDLTWQTDSTSINDRFKYTNPYTIEARG